MNDHGFSTNDLVIVAGVNPGAYNTSGMTNGVVSITRIDADEYSYVVTGLSSRPVDTGTNNNGTSTRTSSAFGYCPANAGLLTSTPQTGNGSTVSTTSSHSTLTEHRTSDREVTTTTVVTPYTRTTVSVNGVLTVNPAGTPGASATTVNTVASTFVPGVTTGPVPSTTTTPAVVASLPAGQAGLP